MRGCTMANLRDKAYQSIKDKILSGDIVPNTFLNEAQLIRELDVSRTPIREALSRLEQEGLVKVLPKKGVLVRALTVSEISQGFEARMLLEPYIIETYMKFIDRKELQLIKRKSQGFVGAPPDAAEFAALDDHLHRLIADACPNSFIRDTLNKVFDQNIRIRVFSERDLYERHIEAAREHITLIDFILKNDAVKAKEAMQYHLTTSRDTEMGALRDKEISAW